MPPSIDADVARLLGSGAPALALQLETGGAPEAAARALTDAAAAVVAATDSAISASTIVIAPGGPLVALRGFDGDTPRAEQILAVIEEQLIDLDPDIELVALDTHGLPMLDRTSNAVLLRVFPPSGTTRLPSAWIDLAGDWLAGDLAPTTRVSLRVLGAEFDVSAADAPGVLHQAGAAMAWCDACSGDPEQRIRTASVSFGISPHLVLGIGGPSVDSHGLLTRFEILCDAAQEFAADAAYVCVDFEQTFGGLATGLSSAWRLDDGAPPHLVAGRLADTAVPDVYPFQILGPVHRAKLGEAFDELEAHEVVPDRFAVRAGDPEDWLPIHDAHDDVQTDLRDLLSPLLLTVEEVQSLLSDELAAADTPLLEVALSTGPEIAEITLDSVAHPRRGTRLTALELVAWLSQARHSDNPPGVSVVLAAFVRLLGQGLADDRRQDLREHATRLVGTRDPETTERGLGPVDRARAWAACDWLVRVQAPGWLHAAGLHELADEIASVGKLDDQQAELLRTVDLLGKAALSASRRVDITFNVASRDDDETELLEQIMWEVWQRASEESGWVAASEAASRSISNDLLYATDLRVIECARDARTRDDLLARRAGIGSQAWAAALEAIASDAWREGWRVAAESVFEQSTFSLDTVIERSRDAVGGELGLDDETAEARYVAAEDAALAALSDAVLRGVTAVDGMPVWDAACRAARSIHGGEVWGLAFDSGRSAVGADVHADAMAAARVAVEELLRSAPDMVARTVIVAVAREAAGAAGRGMALRAAAIARAHSADEDETIVRAVEAIQPTTGALATAAFPLLETMTNAQAG